MKRSQSTQNQRFCKLEIAKLCKIMQKIAKICKIFAYIKKKYYLCNGFRKRSESKPKKITNKISKKMKATTAIKRIERAADKLNGTGVIRNIRMTAGWRLVMNALNSGRKTIRPCYYSGSGRFTSKLDYTSQVTAILKAANISFNLTNDAPRGSETGNLITILNVEH